MQCCILNSGANIFYFDVTHFDKQYGESNLINGFFLSDIFNELKHKNILSVTKLSGRYYLNSEFNFYFDGETCVCSVVTPENSWSKHGIINTRYYSIPYKYCNHFINGIKKCCEGIFIDIEHSFYLYDIIPLNKINYNIIKLNVCGNLAPNGQFIED
jgi:hypothetical protein